MKCSFVPPYLLRQLAQAEGLGVGSEVADCCRTTLAIDGVFRERRAQEAGLETGAARPPRPPEAAWTVHTAENRSELPGRPVRAEGQPESGDAAVDEAAYGIEGSLALFAEAFGRASYDGEGAPVSLTVHYERRYDNAFWDGTQLVFGDGDGEVFERFTKPVDVLGHEFTHAVTEHTAGLVYRGQSGALNESMSDVFAACLKQRLLGQTVTEADWLIGEGLFRPGILARGLRDMAVPGTAYDDPRLGRDPQAGHMDGYVETTDDNGGVHLNSGIPNRAFQLAATAIGGNVWEGAGRIWYAALTGPDVTPTTDFAGFAAATVAAARAVAEDLGADHADAVRDAWAAVGVAGSGPGGTRDGGSGNANLVEVRRSGGFIGRTTAGVVDLDDDPRAPEVRRLLDRIDLRSARGGNPKPDMFVYAFRIGSDEVSVPEQHLTGDLRRLAEIVLDNHS